MCSEPLFIIIQLRVYREESIRTHNLTNQPINKHILPTLIDIFNSHLILHLLLRFSTEGDTKMCVTDYCPHSYSYRMIASDFNFFFMSLVSAFGMLYLYLLLNLSASLIPSRKRKQVALFIVVCS